MTCILCFILKWPDFDYSVSYFEEWVNSAPPTSSSINCQYLLTFLLKLFVLFAALALCFLTIYWTKKLKATNLLVLIELRFVTFWWSAIPTTTVLPRGKSLCAMKMGPIDNQQPCSSMKLSYVELLNLLGPTCTVLEFNTLYIFVGEHFFNDLNLRNSYSCLK